MSKFLPERKKLLEEVFGKASSETAETSFSGILKNLEIILRDEYKITLSYKTFENYYKAIVIEEGDYTIKPVVLDDLSRYLGFDNFNHYCSGWKTVEHTIQQAISKIVITIINKPILAMPEFMKQNGFGMVEVAFVLLLLTGNYTFSKQQNKENPSVLSLLGESAKEEKCMYWDKVEYKTTDCEDDRPTLDLTPADDYLIKYFKKITRKDTLTVQNALGNTWYSKYNGVVEFFTLDGVDPDNGRELRSSTAHIIEKYAGIHEE